MNINDNIAIFGAKGLVGSAIYKELINQGYINIFVPTRDIVDLTSKKEILQFLINNKIDYVFMAAAKVGGIAANMKSPADFGFINGIINLNAIDACYRANVKKLLFLGSSCIYPRECPQPMKEEYLLSGKCEPTNEMYALSKIYGLKLCEAYNTQYKTNFISCQPCNIYGENDHFNTENSHVVSALISKFHKAKCEKSEKVTLWGTGTAKRELLYVSDCANACVFLMNNYNDKSFINIGTGVDYPIKELAVMIKNVVGYSGEIEWDTTKPDGMPRKVLDVEKIHAYGWKHKIDIEEGLIKTYRYYLEKVINA